jgi:hypothetical protein
MLSASEITIQVLTKIVQVTAVGTNLALLQLMWAMANGSFLRSRGAVMTALHLSGFTPRQIHRSMQALRLGVWNMGEMLGAWRGHVLSEGKWVVRRYEGYRPLAADGTTFWRPRLRGWSGKFYQALANRAMTGVGVGVVTEVGQVNGHRIPLLRQIIRPPKGKANDKGVQRAVLEWVKEHAEADEVLLYDGGTHIGEMDEVGIVQYAIRLAVNCVARRNECPERRGNRGRKPEYGVAVRPLARKWRDREIAATPADFQTTFVFQERTIEAKTWYNLVGTNQKADPNQRTFHIWVFHDPAYKQPLVVGTNLMVQGETVYRLYRDRWPVETIPLGAKQMIGLQRQFVFAASCCYRLPELALLIANVLLYLAAILPPIPTAFWDRHPKKRQGDCGVCWPSLIFLKLTSWIADFEKKSRLPTIYPRGLRLIGAKNGLNDLFFAVSCPHC